MARKTLLRQLISKWGIMSTEMQQALTGDSSISEIGAGQQIITTPEGELLPDTDDSGSPTLPDAGADTAAEDEQVDLSTL